MKVREFSENERGDGWNSMLTNLKKRSRRARLESAGDGGNREGSRRKKVKGDGRREAGFQVFKLHTTNSNSAVETESSDRELLSAQVSLSDFILSQETRNFAL